MLITYDTDTQSANCRGNPPCQVTKRHLNNSQTVKNENEMRSGITHLFLVGLLRFFQALDKKTTAQPAQFSSFLTV